MLALRLARRAHPVVQLRRLLVAAASGGTGFLLLCALGYALSHPHASSGSLLRLLWCLAPAAATIHFAVTVARTDPGTRPRPGLSAIGLGPVHLMAVSAVTTALSTTLGSLLALLVFLHLRGDLTGMPFDGTAADALGAGRPLPLPAALTLLALVPAVASVTTALVLRPRGPRTRAANPRTRFMAYDTFDLRRRVNYRYRAGEVRYLLEISGARAAIVDDDLADVVAEAAAPLPGCDLLVRIEPGGGFGAAVAAADRHPRRPRGDTEWRLFTGGTTGHPKAVIGSHAERLRSVRAGGFASLGVDETDGMEALHQALDIDPHGPRGMVHLPASPLMHGTGLYSALGALSIGAPVVLLTGRGVSGAGILDAIARHGVTDLTMVGDAFGLRLLDALDERAAAGRPLGIDSLRRIRSIGAVWSPAVKRRLLAHADLTLLDTIASAEGGVYARSEVTRASIDDEAGSFELVPGARLLDEHGRDVVPGSGTIGVLAAPVVPGAGYEGDAEKTASAFRDIDGVRYTMPGDLATIEADGRLRLLGRGSSVVNTGGEKVFTDEVELVLLSHPAVRDAVVLGVPDPRWGSVVAAVVSPARGASADPDELGAFVGSRLAGYKKPRRIVVVPEVQRLNTGKADLGWARRQFGSRDVPAPTAP